MINQLLRLVLFIPSEAYLILSVIVTVNILITIFYSVFKLKWPDLYFSVNNMEALFISVSFKRFIFFRFLPCFLICVLVVATLTKNNPLYIAQVAGTISLLIHGLMTNGKAIYNLIAKSKRIKIYFNYSFQILLHGLITLFLIGLGFIAASLSRLDFFRLITPTPQGLVDNIWSAFITVVLIEYLRKAYADKSIEINEVFERSLKSIKPELLTHIDAVCLENNANPILVKAICIVENIQRPGWIRFFENLKARSKQWGTYGIMQVRINKNISDEESINIAVKDFFKNSKNIHSPEVLTDYISKYNKALDYKDLVVQAMYFLDTGSSEFFG